MATVNYSISTSSGNSWSGAFTVSSTASTVTSTIPTNLTAGAFSFVPLQFGKYPAVNSYVTWRTPSIAGQYPGSGYSFDVWSSTLYTAINGGATWANLQSTGTYNLDSTKYTLIYNYDAPCTVQNYYGIGGTITFL